MIDSYAYLTDGLHLHMTPQGGTLSATTIRAQQSSKSFSFELLQLSATASRVLSLCTGELTIREIVQTVLKEFSGEPESIIDGAVNFIKECLEKDIITLSHKPVYGKGSFSGSFDYYMPTHITVEITEDCNLECRHCYRESMPGASDRLSTERLLDIIDGFASDGVDTIEITGGEPLTHPDFLKIFQFCVDRFSLIAILSNGILITDKIAARLAEYKEKILVQVDLDGYRAETHEYIRGAKGSFEKAKDAIRVLSKNGIRTRVVMNVVPENFGEVEQTLLLAKSLGAEWFSFSNVLDIGRGKELELLSLNEVKQLSDMAERFAKDHSDFFFIPSEETTRYYQRIGNCGAGYRTCIMGPTGNLRPCAMLPEEYLILGDITKESLRDIFQGEAARFLTTLQAPSEQLCDGCRFLAYCKGCYIRPVYVKERLNIDCKWAKATGIGRYIEILS